LWPPRIPVNDPLEVLEAGANARLRQRRLRTPGYRFTMRVWIALPKKAALYTMNFSPEQRFSKAP